MKINSRLNIGPEIPDPHRLAENAGYSFTGSQLLGMGFTLTPDERADLIRRNERNSERIFPYIGGKEVNTSPTQSYRRYVINFGAMSLSEAEAWPELVEILRTKVKPERDLMTSAAKRFWWRYASAAHPLYLAIAPLSRCLVTSQVTKHLVFSFQPTGRVYSKKLYVFPFETASSFAILQSRIHEPWARLLSSTMKNDLSYAASDCFDTFPFPKTNPSAIYTDPDLERIGEKLYETRAAYMIEADIGLTKTYNRIWDRACDDAPIRTLRTLHDDLDRAVLDAYGWGDLDTSSPYFNDQVVLRLFELNSDRARAAARQV